MRLPRLHMLAFSAVLATAVFAGCSSDDDSTPAATASPSTTATATASAQTVVITLTDAGCDPKDLTLKAGPVTFKVTNGGSGAVTEFEILGESDKVLGEIENITPGIEREFSMTLEPGSFVTYCPGGDTERGALTVTS